MAAATPRFAGLFFAGRALVGLALGIGGTAASAYLAELAPAAWRGRFLEANELSVCLGCLGAYGLAFALGDARWRESIGLTAVGLAALIVASSLACMRATTTASRSAD